MQIKEKQATDLFKKSHEILTFEKRNVYCSYHFAIFLLFIFFVKELSSITYEYDLQDQIS